MSIVYVACLEQVWFPICEANLERNYTFNPQYSCKQFGSNENNGPEIDE